MRLYILLSIFLIFLVGCSSISGTKDLILVEQDLNDLGMKSSAKCETTIDPGYGQYSQCFYTMLEDTEVIIELQKFEDTEELDQAYEYISSHLFGSKGLISEDTFGDKSRFRVNSDDDYGAEFNEPGVYYYHLWILKDSYLIHITSKGSEKVENNIAEIGNKILGKF